MRSKVALAGVGAFLALLTVGALASPANAQWVEGAAPHPSDAVRSGVFLGENALAPPFPPFPPAWPYPTYGAYTYASPYYSSYAYVSPYAYSSYSYGYPHYAYPATYSVPLRPWCDYYTGFSYGVSPQQCYAPLGLQGGFF